jgi:cation:H+ antiporter
MEANVAWRIALATSRPACYLARVPDSKSRGVVALIGGLALLAAASSAAVRAQELAPGLAAALCFGAVIAAALLISWGAEAAQFYVSQGLAVAFIALLQVVPEFMVEAVIAWEAGRNGRIDLVFANASGSNRLLTGFGWPLIFFVTDFYHRRKHGRPLDAIRLGSEHAVEIVALLFASSWYLVLIWKQTLSLVDATVLGGAFVGYLWLLNRLPAQEEEGKEELLAPPRFIVELRRPWARRALLFGLFALGGVVMWAVAHPFLVAMQHVAVAIGVSQFAFVQWVAPFLTEFPEKVTAIYWSRTVKLAPMALLNMVSSTVNQFTALVAMIPIAYSLSVGSPTPIAMDPLHRTEIFLSFATTLYGVACLLKFRFTRANAVVMLSLFVLQFFYKGPIDVPRIGIPGASFDLPPIEAHLAVAWAYVTLSVAEVARNARSIQMGRALRETWAAMQRSTATRP